MKNVLRVFEDEKTYKRGLIGVFGLCFLYWVWLIFASNMVIVFDAIGYEAIGRMIFTQGWVEFFSTGPHREPLYPVLIAISMKVGSIFSIEYYYIQKIIQVIFLCVTQLLMLKLFKEIRIHNAVKLIIVLYFGFSPAVVNSAFSLFSEIGTYPFAMALLLFGYYSWRAIHTENKKTVFISSVWTALVLIGLTFVKAIFQYVFLVFLIPFACVAIRNFAQKNKTIWTNAVVFILMTTVMFGSSVMFMRAMYKKYTGNFEFTDRYDRLLYGNAFKRVNELDPGLFLAHFAAIPGEGFCRRFFTVKQCDYTGFKYADFYSVDMEEGVLYDVAKDQVSITRVGLAFNKFLERPGQYLLLTFLESLKMAFWESSNIGYVEYPDLLYKIFHNGVFKNGIRLVISIITYLGLIYCMVFVWKNWRDVWSFNSESAKKTQMVFLTLCIIIPFTGLYSLFSILTRFAFPIIGLYLVCVAVFVSDVLFGGG